MYISPIGYVFIGVLVVLPVVYVLGMGLCFVASIAFGLAVEGGTRLFGWAKKRLGLLVVLSLAIFGAGCQTGGPAATCSPCGDGSITCVPSLADCIADNGGSCETKIGATGLATIVFKADGSYTETSANGDDTGTWSQTDTTILLHIDGGPAAALGLYQDGAVCPYTAVQQ